MKIIFQRINENAILPKKANKSDAGYDLYSIEDYVINPRGRVKIRTGLIWQPDVPKNADFLIEGQIRSKSGLALIEGVSVLNSPGTIDQNYRDEICVILRNNSHHHVEIKKGQKVAQIIFQKIPKFNIVMGTVDLKKVLDRNGGFGSTGKF